MECIIDGPPHSYFQFRSKHKAGGFSKRVPRRHNSVPRDSGNCKIQCLGATIQCLGPRAIAKFSASALCTFYIKRSFL